MDQLANSVLEYPEQLSWIDFSFNYITEIDEVSVFLLFKFNVDKETVKLNLYMEITTRFG